MARLKKWMDHGSVPSLDPSIAPDSRADPRLGTSLAAASFIFSSFQMPPPCERIDSASSFRSSFFFTAAVEVAYDLLLYKKSREEARGSVLLEKEDASRRSIDKMQKFMGRKLTTGRRPHRRGGR
jgi:hypothetical protein